MPASLGHTEWVNKYKTAEGSREIICEYIYAIRIEVLRAQSKQSKRVKEEYLSRICASTKALASSIVQQLNAQKICLDQRRVSSMDKLSRRTWWSRT